ncbi:MAG TPA: SgcJ/EcaC family oxidoreductase [Planctomycetaceae bacterium]|jgi:uncharacterized protein (TIGR02246 family)
MMKRILGACSVILAVAGLCQAWPDGKPKPAAAGQPVAAPGTKAPAAKSPPAKTPAAKTPTEKPAAGVASPAASPKLSPDEEAVRQSAGNLAKAFNQHDAKAFAAAFTADGEYLDEQGAVYHGRKAIEEDFTGFFKENAEARIELVINSTRSIAPGVMAADGGSRFIRAKGADPINGNCSFICTKDGNKWLIASLREVEADDPVPHRRQVKQLEWMVGEWVDEASDSHVHFSCRWDEGGNFLLRDFEVLRAGRKTITGTQRIGYDPITEHLKSWVFDSAGGYADGFFHREGDSWILQSSGATADGQMASGTNIFTRVDDHRMTWGSVDRVIGGERIPDIETVTIVRKPPAPAPRK